MVEIRFPEFPTHVPYTNNKRAPNKFIKVNSQSLYNGKLARFGRSEAVRNLHRFFLRNIPKRLKIRNYPIRIKYIIKTVINHGAISLRKGGICWKYPSEEYIPNWDIENLAAIWIKTGNDSLVRAKVIPDDSIDYVTNIEYEFQSVDNLEDREIIIQIFDKNDRRDL